MPTTEELLALAKKERTAARQRRFSYDKWWPVVQALRDKGMTYRAIHGWLCQSDAEFLESGRTYQHLEAAMSKRFSNLKP